MISRVGRRTSDSGGILAERPVLLVDTVSTFNTLENANRHVPISSDQFEEMEGARDGDTPTPGTNAAKVMAFLREHPDKAFTQSEIVTATEVKAGSVGPTLVRLRDRGRVDHRGNYWRVSDHDRTVDAATRHASAALSTRERDDETPRMDEWRDHAVDPREHRDVE